MPIWGTTLYHIDDLPFDPLKEFTNVVTEYKKKVKDVKVRSIMASPAHGSLPSIKSLAGVEKYAKEFIPDLKDHLNFP